MNQRLRGIPDEEASVEVADLFRMCKQLVGRTSNLMRILAHSPNLAQWFMAFNASVRQPETGAISSVRLRNLATLKTCTVNECKY